MVSSLNEDLSPGMNSERLNMPLSSLTNVQYSFDQFYMNEVSAQQRSPSKSFLKGGPWATKV